MKWRLAKEYFRGAGQVHIPTDTDSIILDVQEDGTFEFEGKQPFPLYSIARIDPLARK